MKKVYKKVENYGEVWMRPVFAPSSAKDEKIIKVKYDNMDTYGIIRIGSCNKHEKKLITTAFILHYLSSEMHFLRDWSFIPLTKFVVNIDDGDVYIKTDLWTVGLERTPSDEAFFLADYINRPRKLKRVLEQQYSYDERRRWKEIIKYYRKWANRPDSIVIK